MELDHVLIVVPDLAVAARSLAAEPGLASVEGGRHPGWGTANRIVPLRGAYLELVTIVDEAEAAASPFGRWVATAEPGRPFGWAVRTDRLDDVARRLGLAAREGARATPDGGLLRWRTAGVEHAAADPSLPFFIEWGAGTPHPGGAGTSRIDRLELTGDADRLDHWLGDHALPIVVRPGEPALTSVVLAGPAGEIVLDRV